MDVPHGRRGLLSGMRLTLVGVTLGGYVLALTLAIRTWDLPALTFKALALLALALFFELVAKAMFAALFRLELGSVGHPVSWRGAISASLTGSAVARLVPAGGALTPSTMAWAVRDEENDAAGAAMRATMLTYAGLLIITGVGLGWMATEGPHPVVFAGAVILATVLIVAGVIVMAGAAWLDRVVDWLPRRLANYLRPTAGGGRVTPVEAVLVALRVSAEAAVLWSALAAFGIFLTPSEVLVAHGLSMIIGGLPGLPGGLGLVEGGLIGVLSLYGLVAGVIVAPILVYRVVDYWIPAGIGLVAFGVISRDRVPGQGMPANQTSPGTGPVGSDWHSERVDRSLQNGQRQPGVTGVSDEVKDDQPGQRARSG